MRYFTLLGFQHWVLAFFLGVIGAIAVYVAWSGYHTRRFQDLDVSDEDEPRHVPGSEHNPVFPLLFFIYIATVFWMIGYLILVGIYGGPII